MDATGQRTPNRLKQLLADGHPALGATVITGSAVVTELLSRVGFDWLWLEMEHTALSEAGRPGDAPGDERRGASTVVRVPVERQDADQARRRYGPGRDRRAQVNTREEAEAAVRAMKYPPVGERGAGLARAQGVRALVGEYYATANHEALTCVMIEHIDGVPNIDAILSAPGVDAIMIGALDLSGSMGLLGKTDDPRVEEPSRGSSGRAARRDPVWHRGDRRR